MGWGEFEIPITIHFRDSTMKPVTVVQLLKLYPPGNQPSSLTKVRRVCVVPVAMACAAALPLALTTGCWPAARGLRDL